MQSAKLDLSQQRGNVELKREHYMDSCTPCWWLFLNSIHSRVDSVVEAMCLLKQSYTSSFRNVITLPPLIARRVQSGDEKEAVDWSGQHVAPTTLLGVSEVYREPTNPDEAFKVTA